VQNKAIAPLEQHQLPVDVKKQLDELRDLSERAEGGDEETRHELKSALRQSSREVIIRASGIGRKAQHLLIGTAAAGDPLTEYALSGRLDMLRSELAGENPTALEVLLAERVAACWMLVELFEVLMAAQLSRDNKHHVPLSYLKHMIKWQESANRRYLASIRELAGVRKLQSNTPGIQYNTQITWQEAALESSTEALRRQPRG
jgi:hypothetical protein